MICPFCTSSFVKRDGKRYNKSGTCQRYECNTCGKKYSTPEVSDIEAYQDIDP